MDMHEYKHTPPDLRTCLTCGLIILNYKDYLLTEELLSRIKDSPEIDYIVVVDNDSPNDSYTQLKKYENAKVSVLQSGRNGGYSFGNNVGAKYLIEKHNPDIIGIANPDTIFDGALVERIKEVFAANPDYAVLAGFQVTPSGENSGHPFWEGTGTPKDMLKRYIHLTLVKPLTTLFDKLMHIPNYSEYVESVRVSKNIPHQVWAVEGSLFFVRSEDLEAVGLFDENVFMYCEEDILAFKIHKQLHKKVGVVNSVKYIHAHKHPDTVKKQASTTKAVIASSIYYFNHHLTGNKILQALHVFFAYLSMHRIFTIGPLKKLLGMSKTSSRLIV